MKKACTNVRCDGWTLTRRTAFLGALRVSGKVGDACAWVGMSSAGAYKLAKREPGFAAAWDAALTARHGDRRPTAAKPIDALSNAELMRRLRRCEAKLESRPRGVVAQQNKRWASSCLNFDGAAWSLFSLLPPPT